MKEKWAEGRAPFLDLTHPVVKSRFRDNDDMRILNILKMLQEAKKGYGLKSFPETL